MTIPGFRTAQQLIEGPLDSVSHVVLLGAGASRASFPKGDRAGKLLPVMSDLTEILELRRYFDEANVVMKEESNFEVAYSQLLLNPECSPIARKIEVRIEEYFSELSLPEHVTVYDRLLLSLRPTDAIFTFNWDPFLFDAYKRNRSAASLPGIFFLHGNVRIAACPEHNEWGERNMCCSRCHQRFTPVSLLYPIQKKNYADNSYIRTTWESAKTCFKDASTITIFGYGAPDSDSMAVDLLKVAWFDRHERKFEHVQIIDTAPEALLHERWSAFTPTSHLNTVPLFENSRIDWWPRRSAESLFYSMSQGVACQQFPLAKTESLSELQAGAAVIARNEDVF